MSHTMALATALIVHISNITKQQLPRIFSFSQARSNKIKTVSQAYGSDAQRDRSHPKPPNPPSTHFACSAVCSVHRQRDYVTMSFSSGCNYPNPAQNTPQLRSTHKSVWEVQFIIHSMHRKRATGSKSQYGVGRFAKRASNRLNFFQLSGFSYALLVAIGIFGVTFTYVVIEIKSTVHY